MELKMNESEEAIMIANQKDTSYFTSDTDSISEGVEHLTLSESRNNQKIREIKKLQSDSTSVVSDLSDRGVYSENLTDSDTKGNSSSTRKKSNTKVMNIDEYPRINQRSKSQMFKKKVYIENPVNEETVEDEYDRDQEVSAKRKPFKYSNINFNDDLPTRISRNTFTLQCIKSVALSPSSRSLKGRSHTVTIMPIDMDPVVEVREEETRELRENLINLLNSPRVKLITDNKEDVTLSTSSFHFFNTKDYSIEANEVITEDNNENNVETDCKIRKKESKHKILENIIDKEENYDIPELNVNVNANFEIIDEEKEENADEVEFIQHKISREVIPVSDEFEKDSLKFTSGFRLPVIDAEDEDLINEDEEIKNENELKNSDDSS